MKTKNITLVEEENIRDVIKQFFKDCERGTTADIVEYVKEKMGEGISRERVFTKLKRMARWKEIIADKANGKDYVFIRRKK